MGMFLNYNKPGSGIDKNAPKKRGLFLFFEILFRKLFKIMQVNMVYFLCSIPMMAILYFICSPYIMTVFARIQGISFEDPNVSVWMNAISLWISVLGVIFIGSGPASCGLSYILRCFAREESTFVVSDFFAKMRENFKYGIVINIVSIIILVSGCFSINFYYQYYLYTNSAVWLGVMGFLGVLIVTYMFSHIYVYQLMVTLKCSLLDLYKNSIIIAMATLPQNLILSAIVVILSYKVYTLFLPEVTIVLSFLLLIGLFRFPFEFYADSVIRKRILPNMENKAQTEENDEV